MNPEMLLVMWAFATAAIGGETPISALRLTGAMNANRQAVTNMVPGTAADRAATVGQVNTTNAALRAEWQQDTSDAVAGEAQARGAADVGLSAAQVASNALARAAITVETNARIAGDAALLASNALALAAIVSEAGTRVAGDVVAMTNWQGVVFGLTNGAALGSTALQPGDTVDRAYYAVESGHATNADFSATSALSSNSLTAVHAQTATALALPDGGIGWKVGSTNYVVMPDTNRVYIVSVSGDFNGPAVGSVFTNRTVAEGVLNYYFGNFAFYVDISGAIAPITAWNLISSDFTSQWAADDAYSDIGQYFHAVAGNDAEGFFYADYVPVTNITVDVSAATVIILAARTTTNETDIAALEAGVPAAGCLANGTGTTLTITGAPPPIAWQAKPSGALAVSVAANAPRNRFYSITAIGKAVSAWPSGALVSTNTSGTSPFLYAIGPYTGALWQVVGGGR